LKDPAPVATPDPWALSITLSIYILLEI